MFGNILFYIVFLSQIILVSYYYPRLILIRLNDLFKNYPPEKYPRFYSKELSDYKKETNIFRTVNQIILASGLVLIIAIGFWQYSYNRNIPSFLPFIFFIIQAAPIIKMEISRFANFNLIKNADLPSVRKAELQPRRLFNFISPVILGIAILLFFSCILFFLYINKFEFYFWNQVMVIFIALTLSHTLFISIAYKNLYGKKTDPYSAAKDRTKQIEVNIKSLIFISIGATIFLIVMGAINKFDLRYLAPSIMSFYLQFIIVAGVGYLLRTLRIENIDFEVYKTE